LQDSMAWDRYIGHLLSAGGGGGGPAPDEAYLTEAYVSAREAEQLKAFPCSHFQCCSKRTRMRREGSLPTKYTHTCQAT